MKDPKSVHFQPDFVVYRYLGKNLTFHTGLKCGKLLNHDEDVTEHEYNSCKIADYPGKSIHSPSFHVKGFYTLEGTDT